jgi:hypothetical protein
MPTQCNYCEQMFIDRASLNEHIYSSDCLQHHNVRRRRNRNRRDRYQTESSEESSEESSGDLYESLEERKNHPDGEDEESVHKDYTCSICLNNKVRILSTNCGHLCCCIGCSKNLYNSPIEKRKCPICRNEWNILIKIH